MTVEILLTKGYTTFVDDVDADLAEMKWHAHTFPQSNVIYAQRDKQKERKKIRYIMHKVILERIIGRTLIKGEEVDHVDLNGLNNRRGNLRLATHQQNQRNKGKYKNNKTGYKGVFKVKNIKSDRWIASISVDGKHLHLGSFGTPELAHQAYCEAANKYGREFARAA